MSQRYDNIKRPKPLSYSARDLKNLCILLENSAEGFGSRRERCWYYVVFVFKNTPKNLVVQGRTQLEHSSHIVKVGVEATCLHFSPWSILRETTEPAGPFGTMPQEPWILERVPNRITLSNSTAGKCAPMQVIKQPEHGRTSTTEEQKWSSFQTNYDQ